MNNSKLKSRLHYIPASPAPKRTASFSFSKRDSNYVAEEVHPHDAFTDFFDYEDDLSTITPSNQLFFEDREDDFYTDVESSGIIMESNYDNDNDNDESKENTVEYCYNESESYSSSDFVEISDNYCIYHLSSGSRCEHEKKSGSLFCIAHQQL